MVILYLIGITLSVAIAALMYMSTAHWSIKALILMQCLVLGVVATDVYKDNLGAPIHGRPDGQFKYLAHETDPEDGIILWAFHERLGYRQFVFEYDREDAKILKKAEEASKGSQDRYMTSDDFGFSTTNEEDIWVHNQNVVKPDPED